MKMLEKLQKRLQQGKKDNKGFSLVELIIVIAIMAILIGIVGMNVLPQIENARQSKDLQLLSAYLSESVEAVTQNASNCKDDEYTLTITPGAATLDALVKCTGSSDTVGAGKIRDAFLALSGIQTADDIKFESTEGGKITSIDIKLKLAAGGGNRIAEMTLNGTSSLDVSNLYSK